ncbi:MAG: YbjQ family protein [Gammaproteobacteria bacterium]|nr:YbjQ family protein [Gammaproteobacteria bacterium]
MMVIPRVSSMEKTVILSTLQTIPGRTIREHYGLVSGSTIRAKHVGRDFAAGLKNIFGGELKGYTELLQESRSEATERMIAQAEQMGANAIVNIRYATSAVAPGAAELFAYGTAVFTE